MTVLTNKLAGQVLEFKESTNIYTLEAEFHPPECWLVSRYSLKGSTGGGRPEADHHQPAVRRQQHWRSGRQPPRWRG